MENSTQTTQNIRTIQFTKTKKHPECFLVLNKQNKFGGKQYVCTYKKTQDTISIESLLSYESWSIKSPNLLVIKSLDKHHPGWGKYTNSKHDIFALSPRAAATFYIGYGQATATRVCFKDPFGKSRFIVVSDNKHHMQNIQGGTKSGEAPFMACKRQVLEKINVDLKKQHFVPIGGYSYLIDNALIEDSWQCLTFVFAIYLNWDNVKHLFPNGLVENEYSVTIISDLLDKNKYYPVEQIFSIPCDTILDFPESLDLYKKRTVLIDQTICSSLEFKKIGHHRQILEKILTNEKIIKPEHLLDIYLEEVSQNEQCLIQEWNESNPKFQFL